MSDEDSGRSELREALEEGERRFRRAAAEGAPIHQMETRAGESSSGESSSSEEEHREVQQEHREVPGEPEKSPKATGAVVRAVTRAVAVTTAPGRTVPSTGKWMTSPKEPKNN